MMMMIGDDDGGGGDDDNDDDDDDDEDDHDGIMIPVITTIYCILDEVFHLKEDDDRNRWCRQWGRHLITGHRELFTSSPVACKTLFLFREQLSSSPPHPRSGKPHSM